MVDVARKSAFFGNKENPDCGIILAREIVYVDVRIILFHHECVAWNHSYLFTIGAFETGLLPSVVTTSTRPAARISHFVPRRWSFSPT
jgi:hypothetical protein